MPFVVKHQRSHHVTPLLKRGDQLFRLVQRDTRVILPMDHQQRCGDVIYLSDWRYRGKQLTILFQRSIFRLPVATTPWAGALEEGHKVADADNIYGGKPEIRVFSDRGKRHESAVTLPHHRDSSGGTRNLFSKPLVGMLKVMHRIEPQLNVIEMRVGFPVSGTPPHICRKNVETAGSKELKHWVKPGSSLTLGTTMHIDDDRRLIARCRAEPEGRYPPAVERGVRDRLRGDTIEWRFADVIRPRRPSLTITVHHVDSRWCDSGQPAKNKPGAIR